MYTPASQPADEDSLVYSLSELKRLESKDIAWRRRRSCVSENNKDNPIHTAPNKYNYNLDRNSSIKYTSSSPSSELWESSDEEVEMSKKNIPSCNDTINFAQSIFRVSERKLPPHSLNRSKEHGTPPIRTFEVPIDANFLRGDSNLSHVELISKGAGKPSEGLSNIPSRRTTHKKHAEKQHTIDVPRRKTTAATANDNYLPNKANKQRVEASEAFIGYRPCLRTPSKSAEFPSAQLPRLVKAEQKETRTNLGRVTSSTPSLDETFVSSKKTYSIESAPTYLFVEKNSGRRAHELSDERYVMPASETTKKKKSTINTSSQTTNHFYTADQTTCTEGERRTPRRTTASCQTMREEKKESKNYKTLYPQLLFAPLPYQNNNIPINNNIPTNQSLFSNIPCSRCHSQTFSYQPPPTVMMLPCQNSTSYTPPTCCNFIHNSYTPDPRMSISPHNFLQQRTTSQYVRPARWGWNHGWDTY